MTRIQVNGKELLVVDVPDVDSEIRAILLPDSNVMNLYFVNQDGYDVRPFIPLPPGSWQLIELGSEITEDVWREIVMNEHGDLFDYSGKNMFCATATQSGLSLLAHHGYDPDKCILLMEIKKEEV